MKSNFPTIPRLYFWSELLIQLYLNCDATCHRMLSITNLFNADVKVRQFCLMFSCVIATTRLAGNKLQVYALWTKIFNTLLYTQQNQIFIGQNNNHQQYKHSQKKRISIQKNHTSLSEPPNHAEELVCRQTTCSPASREENMKLPSAEQSCELKIKRNADIKTIIQSKHKQTL